MSDLIYEASVYSRTVKYKNFKGETQEVKLYFALDPISLLQTIAGFNPRPSKSGNPARRGQTEVSDEEMIKFVRDICVKAAGTPSEDGEVWEPFPDFADSLAGKAFLTKLTSSDGDRKEFADKVILDPFRSFVGFAAQDESNSPKEVQEFKQMLEQIERIFAGSDKAEETREERRERLRREMEALDTDGLTEDEK